MMWGFNKQESKPSRPKSPPSQSSKSPCLKASGKCKHHLSRKLRFDTEVPGDRGDCTQRSLCEGSE